MLHLFTKLCRQILKFKFYSKMNFLDTFNLKAKKGEYDKLPELLQRLSKDYLKII